MAARWASRATLAAAVLLVSTAAVAEDAANVASTGGASLKSLTTDHGILGSIIGVLVLVSTTLWGLYLRERPLREAALSKQSEAHTKELADKDAAHAKDRAEWAASTTILQESRLSLQREVLIAIERATSVMSATQNSISERTQSSGQVVDQLSSLTFALQRMRSDTEEDREDLKKRIGATLSAIEKLSQTVKGEG